MSADRNQLKCPFPKVFVCLLFLKLHFFWKVTLIDNIKNELHNVCILLPVMVSVSTNVWPLTWLDRLIHFLGAAWKFYLDLWPVGSAILLSAMVSIYALYTRRSWLLMLWRGEPEARLARRGWWEGSSRLPADVVSGALCLFNQRMWNINLSSPLLHCIICEVTHEAMLVQLPLQWGTL